MSDTPENSLSPEEQSRRADATARLLQAQEKMREMRASGWKPVVLNPREKAKANPKSLKLAIRAHCWECCGGDAKGNNVRQRVHECDLIEKCALWPHRPWQKLGAAGAQEPDDDIVETPEETTEE